MKRLINRFTRWVRKMSKEEKVIFTIGGLIGLIAAIVTFTDVDTVPATASDYEPMKQQVIAIQENPDLLFNTDCNIHIKDEVITVDFENDQCKLTVQYNQNFEVLSISEGDYCCHWTVALALSLFIGFVMFFFGTLLAIIIVAGLEAFWKFIRKKFKQIKANFPKRCNS